MSNNEPQKTQVNGGQCLARHRVRAAIEELILSGAYQPGQRLVQQDLAERFGVAQSVVRESLLELQFCGLVKAVDRLGMFVGELDPKTLLEGYQIRELLEGLAARLCCETASRSDIRELRRLAEGIYDLAREGDIEQMSRRDREFHFRMVQIAGNQLAARLTEGYRVLGMFLRADRPRRQIRDEHLGMIDAIENNQPDVTERIARHHVHEASLEIQKQITEGTFVLHWVGQSTQTSPERPETTKAMPGKGSSRKKSQSA